MLPKMMGKRKDTSTEEDVNVDVIGNSPHKKHKKHKHKKHKKKKERLPGQDPDFSSGDGGDTPKPLLKLKIKIGGQTLGEKSVAKVIPESASDDELNVEGKDDDDNISNIDSVIEAVTCNIAGTLVTVDSDISDEDAWLEALESGKLDEYDELKRMKDPALMTARQRALVESKTQRRDTPIPDLQMLPSGYKEKEMTEEMLQKRALRAKKRRQQAQEKREKDKKLTIDRLLKKQETKAKGNKLKASKKAEVPKITYLNNQGNITMSFPLGYDFPLPAQGPKPQPLPKTLCGVKGCKNLKKYSCSKTGVPLCSLECYRKNQDVHLGLMANSVRAT